MNVRAEIDEVEVKTAQQAVHYRTKLGRWYTISFEQIDHQLGQYHQ